MRTRMRLVITLVGLGTMLSLWNRRLPPTGKMLDGCPVLVIADGKMQHDAMNRERVDNGDIISAAGDKQGLESLDQIKHAVVRPRHPSRRAWATARKHIPITDVADSGGWKDTETFHTCDQQR